MSIPTRAERRQHAFDRLDRPSTPESFEFFELTDC
jgi:hypothetical protein